MATELGKAYVQIVPSAKGIQGGISKALDGEADSAGKSAGEKTGSSFASKFKNILIAAGIGKAITSAFSAGGSLEQSLGGVETLFKDNADTVKKYAEEAYKTAGLSANDYMENVTSFSASLLQSLGGDTEKAAETAHMAMVDMSDNANKMGTDMGSIQSAYQGFAKQNYTMLDNLKLGYGGTKTEMERLLVDAEKLTGVKYDIDSLDDVYSAIHVIQEEMGITGTTAKESAETFSGSLQSMKSAFSNVLGTIATGGNVGTALQGLSETIITFVSSNMLPMLTNILTQVPNMLVTLLTTLGPQLLQSGIDAVINFATGLAQALPTLIPQAIQAIITLVNTFVENIPLLIDAALQLITGLAQGLLDALPVVIDAVPTIIEGLIDAILKAIPVIIQAGIDLLTSLIKELPKIISAIVKAIPKIVQGITKAITENVPLIIQAGIDLLVALVEDLPVIIQAIIDVVPVIVDSILKAIFENVPIIIEAGVRLLTALVENLPSIILMIVEAIPSIIDGIVNALTNNIPMIIDTGVKLFMAIIENLPTIIIELAKSMPQIIEGLVNALLDGIGSIIQVGADIVSGLWEGIKNAASWLWDQVTGWLSDLWGGILGFFGISSPSKEMAWVGEMLNRGLAGGIEDNMKPVTRAMDNLGDVTTRSFESDIAFNAVTSTSGIGGLNSSLSSGLISDSRQEADKGKPMSVTFVMGNYSFKGFVEDITKMQDRTVELELSY